MKRFFVIGFLWLGLVGAAVAGPPIYDYVPEPFGIDFSTAPKPHMEAPGGEWHVISGDGTIYPDIINYCDPDKDPECFAHLYMACHAWTIYRKTKTGGHHFPSICEEAGVKEYIYPHMLMAYYGNISGMLRKTALFYYKLDTWKLDGMLYHLQKSCELPPIEEIPFEKKDRWRGKDAIDIYFGYCKPQDECLTNGGDFDLPLTEADKNCPVTDCQGYGFEKQEEVNDLGEPNNFIYPQVSLGWPAKLKDGTRGYFYNYSHSLLAPAASAFHCFPNVPARWLQGHPLSEYNERNKSND